MRQIILASTSRYRQQLLKQLQLPFTAVAPQFSEQIDQTLAPAELVQQLAEGKARSLAETYPEALIIGSDQVFVDASGTILGKPGNRSRALQQLSQMAGKSHTFYTGLVLLDSRSGELQQDCVTFSVTLRRLTARQISDYLDREQPFDCAGSFKIEGLGIALMERMAGDDYNALIGLPLIRLVGMLQQVGVDILPGKG